MTPEGIEEALSTVAPLSAYLLIFVLMAVNGLAMLPPSELLCLVSGAFIYRLGWSPTAVLGSALAGNLLGHTIAFLICRRYSEAVLSSKFGAATLKPLVRHRLSPAWLGIGRLVPGLRSKVSFAAGVGIIEAETTLHFLARSSWGLFAWIAAFNLAGALLYEFRASVLEGTRTTALAVLILILALMVTVILTHRRTAAFREPRFYHSSALMIGMLLWPLHRCFRREHRYLLLCLNQNERVRIETSALRTACFLHVFRSVLGIRRNRRVDLLVGMLAAIFDNLIDEKLEDRHTIRGLVVRSADVACTSDWGLFFRWHYEELRAQLSPWQQTALETRLIELLAAEFVLHEGEVGRDWWRRRGTLAFVIYLTVIGVDVCSLEQQALHDVGEYLQLLDDYEDYSSDHPESNYMARHGEIDLNDLYRHTVRPALELLFPVARNGTPTGFDTELLRRFIETYHVAHIAKHRKDHAVEPPLVSLRMAITRKLLHLFCWYLPF